MVFCADFVVGVVELELNYAVDEEESGCYAVSAVFFFFVPRC